MDESFLEFLVLNSIDKKEYDHEPLSRFIRWKTGEKPLFGCRVAWFPQMSFYSLDPDFKLAQSTAYQEAKVYGMDIASAVTCHALDIEPNDHVLDLCCAPGAKLCLLHDLLTDKGTGTITGVDITKHRLHIAKRIVGKYGLDRVRMFLMDGVTFDIPPPYRLGPILLKEFVETRKTTFVVPFHATKLIRSDPQTVDGLYDKVLCDVECTHDASIAHLKKYEGNGWRGFRDEFLDPKRLSNLQTLQQGLIMNAWRQLKVGGLLVYSTCSFSERQNEEILIWFMREVGVGQARVEKIPGSDGFPVVEWDSERTQKWKNYDWLGFTLRFSPRESKTSGLFMARIRKLSI